MLRSIGWILAGILVVVGCFWLYNHVTTKDVIGNGEVIKPDEPRDSRDSKDHLDIDGNRASDTTKADRIAASLHLAPADNATPALPPSDSITPNPPNGMVFAGTGEYQLYRQGNITWRLNTKTGTSCIAFATMEEWGKPLVYSHGCGRA